MSNWPQTAGGTVVQITVMEKENSKPCMGAVKGGKDIAWGEKRDLTAERGRRFERFGGATLVGD